MIDRFNKRVLVISAIFCLIAIYFLHLSIESIHTEEFQNKSKQRIDLYQNALRNELTRFNFLPFVIARDEQLINWSFKQSDQANIALESIKKASGANVLYIMDASGKTLSSSNWKSKTSFVNRTFAFRPYFKEALKGNNGQFFGIGTTSKKPGFYISTGVRNQEKVIAVTVAKVDLSVLENIWINAGENIFITNRDGVVILSSKKQWKYRTLRPLEESQIENIKAQKQFANIPLVQLLDNQFNTQKQLSIGGNKYLHQEVDIKSPDWKIHYLIPTARVDALVIQSWTRIGLIIFGIMIVLLMLWLFQSRNKLKTSLKESAELRELNDLLNTEIEHRQRVEDELLVAQKDIKRSSKLAAMGQISASIIHELGQPLAAMKTYIAGAIIYINKNGRDIQDKEVFDKLDSLVERMSRISEQLKFFSHSVEKDTSNIDVRKALDGALLVVGPTIEEHNIELIFDFEDKPYIINAGQIRMEQVFTNLISNAIAALEKSKNKRITVHMEIINNNQLVIKIEDTGKGISEEILHMLFDPFYTTKPSGVGLGLGLSISTNIIHEFHGSLTALNNTNEGASFIITMPIVYE
jgi:two-component system C4-dicarboxylate transport sensor histidine kinase DctB